MNSISAKFMTRKGLQKVLIRNSNCLSRINIERQF